MSIIIIAIVIQVLATISMILSHKDICPFSLTIREFFHYWACMLSCVNLMILSTQYDTIAAITLS